MRHPLPGCRKKQKALNHKDTESTKEKLFFVPLVFFVVPFLSGPFATTSFTGMTHDASFGLTTTGQISEESVILITFQQFINGLS